jgi:protein-S-isoprenylcysteine O-methyltransferase Ste14
MLDRSRIVIVVSRVMDRSFATSGGFVFAARRFRRYLPLLVGVTIVAGLKPWSWQDEFLNSLTTWIGIVFCVLGQGWRLWAWGSNANAGKRAVRSRGPYALMRHPLYAGNFLIIVGVAVSFNNPWAYLLLLVSFAYLYHLITNFDERRMSQRLGAAYEFYRRENLWRFVPQFRKLRRAMHTTTPFNCRYAWRKEYNSICAWLAGVSSLAIYRDAVTYGWKQAWYRNPVSLGITGFCGVLAILLNMWRRIIRKNDPTGKT